MNRAIAHFDLDAFFVSVERLKDDSLKGKPLIVGGREGRGVVAACSYEARKFGVHSAMPMKTALRLCPQATVVRGRYEDYTKYSRLVTNIMAEYAPVFEKASIDEFYLDLTGMDKFFGCYDWTIKLKQTIMRETGLPISFALATNKLIAKIATNEVKPNGQINVPAGMEAAYLAPLSVDRMPMIGKETSALLKKYSITTLGKLAELSPDTVQSLLGNFGLHLQERARGIDDSPVVNAHQQKSISTENTFHHDVNDVVFMENMLLRMTEEIAMELRSKKKLTACVSVKIRYASFETFTKQTTIPHTACDDILWKEVKKLFHALYIKKMQVRLLGVRFSHLNDEGFQLNLFDDSQRKLPLYRAMDNIKTRFGDQAVMRGKSV